MINDKWGFANNDMDIVIPAQWDYASYFRASEVAKVGIKQADGNYLYGLIDVEGNCVVPCEYSIHEGESGAYFAGEDGYYHIYDAQSKLCGYYDIKNRFFCPPIYEDVILWFRNEKNIVTAYGTLP
ncbi:MAG: WG repeat-containing protein [Eubacteriales bacterium]|nr:WG repeat-containing protein [Eubacteriales bacterium]MDD3883006.1 WG repeat-containing protein [Eubacteriales bacterium]MDD4513886.1 WG repeat-containing protein [Eubacteriales bacterium]